VHDVSLRAAFFGFQLFDHGFGSARIDDVDFDAGVEFFELGFIRGCGCNSIECKYPDRRYNMVE
jgi:hypothetical protein